MLWTCSTTVALGLSLGCNGAPRATPDALESPVDSATPPGEAAVTHVTMSQTNSMDVTSGVGCRRSPTNYIVENNYYRAFKLADYGVTGAFHVTKATFGVSSAHAGGTSMMQPARISIFAYPGNVGGATIDLSMLTGHGEATVQVHDTTTGGAVDVPIDAQLPAGTSALVVQLHVDDGTTTMNQLMLGANQQGESTPAYQLAPLCGQTSPVSLPAAGLPNFALVLSVTGDG